MSASSRELTRQNRPPRSAYDRVGGLVYFARMLDKIRLHLDGRLPSDYHEYLGAAYSDTFDARCTRYLRVRYEDVVAQVAGGGSDEEILEWCYQNGHRLSDEDIFVWNAFMRARGRKDEVSEELEEGKRKAGLGDRQDLDTFFAFYEVDEGRSRG